MKISKGVYLHKLLYLHCSQPYKTRQDKTKHFILSVHKYGNMRNDKYRYTKEANMCNDNIV